MPDPNTGDTNSPRVSDKRVIPPGILPKNIQTWMVCGIALAMVIVIAFSGRNTPKDRSTPPPLPPTVIDPSQTRIEEYRKRIEEQTRKLALEQAALAHQEMLPPNNLSNTATLAGQYRGSPNLYSSSEASVQRSQVQAEKAKRDYDSLFASNVALSYRKEAQAAEPAPTLSPENLAKFLPLYAALTAIQPAPTAATSLKTQPPGNPTGVLPTQKVEDFGERSSGPERPNEQRYRLFEGTVLETVLTNRLSGSFSGPVNCMVTTNVYSRDGQHLLIPQGSRVLGEIRKVESFGQERLAVFFHRLIMPDGYSITLDQFQGLNQIGGT